MTDIEQHDSLQVFVDVEVGKGAHHAVVLDRKGKRLLDSALPNDKTKLRALIGKLKEHGQVLLVVDQPATVGALPVAVARDEGVLVAYLPGLAMRRIADLHAGEAKTDARDAYIIAEAARSLPHTLRSLKLAETVMDVAEAVQRRCLSLLVVPLAVQVEVLLAVLAGLSAVAQSR